MATQQLQCVVFVLDCGHTGHKQTRFLRLPRGHREQVCSDVISGKHKILCGTCKAERAGRRFVGVFGSDVVFNGIKSRALHRINGK